MPDISPPQGTTASVQLDNLRTPDQRTASAAKPELAGRQPEPVPAEPVAAQARSAPQAPSAPLVPSGGGLSAFLIVLISVGGASALCGIADTAIRIRHQHGHAVG